MSLALEVRNEGISSNEGLSRWVGLPGFCCQAAGGRAEWADDLTVAWLLFYAAADLMDKVQDQDQPAPWWGELGPGAALSAATGLYFSANLVLSRLYDHAATRSASSEVTRDLYNGFLEMTSGQYGDLSTPHPTLEMYWRIIAAKSGGFFGLACRSSARLAIQDEERLRGFEDYGRHLGMLVQIRDDLEDIRPVPDKGTPGQRRELARSLPVIYALSVLPEVECKRLRHSLAAAPGDEAAANEVIRILDTSNAALYLAAELARHRQMALDSIRHAAVSSPSRDSLEAYLEQF